MSIGQPLYENMVRNWRSCQWELKLALLPHRCAASGQLIWFKYAYRGIRFITGPGEPVVLKYWMTTEEFMTNRIKGVF
jgi:hypothetical protein